MKYKIKNNFVLKCFTYSSLVYLFFATVFLTIVCINTYNIVNTYEKLEGVYSENYISFVDGDNQEYHIEETSNIFEENEEVIVYLHKTDKTKVHYHKILFDDVYNFIKIDAVILLAYVILQVILSIKNKREKYIIRLRFFEGKTQIEVAEDIDISQAQVSRLEKHALKVMRQYLFF